MKGKKRIFLKNLLKAKTEANEANATERRRKEDERKTELSESRKKYKRETLEKDVKRTSDKLRFLWTISSWKCNNTQSRLKKPK